MGELIKKGAWNFISMIILVWHKSFGTVQISAWLLQCGAINCPVLVLEAPSHNVVVPFVVCLLPSSHSKGILSLGIFSRLEKAALMLNLVNCLTFGVFCAILQCLVVAGTFWGLGSTYTIGFGLQRHRPLLLCIRTLPKFLCLDP